MWGHQACSCVQHLLRIIPVDPENPAGLRIVAKQIGENLHVHTGTVADGGEVVHARDFVIEVFIAGTFRWVLRRVRGVGHQPFSIGMFHEKIHEEVYRSLDHRVHVLEIRTVQRIEIVFPQMGGQPGTAHRERAPGRSIHGCGHTPDVGVLVEHPAPGPVMFVRYLGALIGQFLDQRDQRLGTIGQVARFHGPVVHLEIDIGGVLGIPTGILIFVPDPLQVGRFCAWA